LIEFRSDAEQARQDTLDARNETATLLAQLGVAHDLDVTARAEALQVAVDALQSESRNYRDLVEKHEKLSQSLRNLEGELQETQADLQFVHSKLKEAQDQMEEKEILISKLQDDLEDTALEAQLSVQAAEDRAKGMVAQALAGLFNEQL
jgi:chromosome segregation ATPase